MSSRVDRQGSGWSPNSWVPCLRPRPGGRSTSGQRGSPPSHSRGSKASLRSASDRGAPAGPLFARVPPLTSRRPDDQSQAHDSGVRQACYLKQFGSLPITWIPIAIVMSPGFSNACEARLTLCRDAPTRRSGCSPEIFDAAFPGRIEVRMQHARNFANTSYFRAKVATIRSIKTSATGTKYNESP